MVATRKRFVRFALVGAVNTLVDALIFALLHMSGVSVLIANFISSSCGLLVSLVLNSRYTFRVRQLTTAQVVWFVAINITGLWILQPLCIDGLLCLLHHSALHEIFTTKKHGVFTSSFIASLSATAGTFLWNYVMYTKVVYKKRDRS